jgi:hypothetical protein
MHRLLASVTIGWLAPSSQTGPSGRFLERPGSPVLPRA